MNSYIESYIKQATAFFPIVGKQEKLYLTRLSHSIEDYFAESEPDSLDTIIQGFGLPQTVVRDYFAHSDTLQIVKRIRVRKFTRICTVTGLILCLMTALLIAVHLSLNLKALHEVEEYNPPTYSTDGTELE